MQHPKPRRHRLRALLAAALLHLIPPANLYAEPTPTDQAAFLTYTTAVEHRLTQQHATTFLAPLTPTEVTRLHKGELLIAPVDEPTQPTPNSTLHHWRGTAFLPRTHAAAFDHLLRNLAAYPTIFSPEVVSAAVLATDPTPLPNTAHLETALRLREHHVLTVTLDTTYDLTLTHPTPTRGFSTARSTRVTEIANPNTPTEHPLTPADAHGFLLRLNTYWTWEEHPDGLTFQIETISLSRPIPTGLTWALRPYTNSIPRDSLTFTLNAVRTALTR